MSPATPTRRTNDARRLNGLTWLCVALVVLGALNWGLVGLFNFNLVGAIFGGFNALTRTIYVVVALAGLYVLIDVLRGPRTTRRA